MNKELIYIDGQEGFIKLDLLKEWEITFDGIQKESGSWNDWNKKIFFGITPKSKKDKYQMIKSSIIRSRLDKEYNAFFNKYDKKIDNVIEKIEEIRKKQYKSALYKRYKLMKLNKEVNKLLRLKSQAKKQAVNKIELTTLENLLNLIPKKYHSEIIEKVEINSFRKKRIDGMELKLHILRLNLIFIPYLEQQLELKRISLSYEEISLINAFKEMIRVIDEGMTFENYLDNWIKKLWISNA